MANEQFQVPTLLLGLGGIGSQIVDSVYGRIPEHIREEELIGVHAFDTNVNDIKQLEHLGDHVTQTSAEMRVKDYLHLAGPIVEDWFPRYYPNGEENHVLLNKTLTEGAGQIRPVSRLALRAAMEEGALEDFEADVRSLLRAQGDEVETSLRVMIVCSVVGGTGAGMFLQTALYLRDYLRNHAGVKSFLIRGAFVLPDVLINNSLIPSAGEQEESVKANAYASLKELDAITKNAGPTIELEYKPNQVTASGDRDLSVSREEPPFKFSFLYDYENTAGKNLGDFQSYLRQVTKTVQLQLFSPVSEEQFSDEDNVIMDLMAGRGGPRYAGAGVATLEYPYEDIVDYCALRWASSALSEQWLRLDDEYDQELDEWKKDKEAGINRPKPKIEERYVKLLDMHAKEDNADPFYRQVYESAHKRDEDGRPTQPKSEAFLEALVQRIENHAEDDPDVQEKLRKSDQALQEDLLADREHARKTVQRSERALRNLEDEVKKFIDENKTVLFNQAVLRDYHEPDKTGGQAYRLNTWILEEEGAPLHPVATRYFLYQVRLGLDDKLSTLRTRCDNLKDAIDSYDEAFDVPGTERTEEPRDRVHKALNQGLLGRLFNNKLSSFADLYRNRARSQRQNLVAYQQARLKERVLRSVLEAVDDMLDQLETYFENLRDVKDRLEERTDSLAVEHEDRPDQTRRFVLASQEDKEYFWDDISLRLASNVLLTDQIAEEIYIDQYDRYCEKRRSRQSFRERATREDRKGQTARQFEDTVVSWCRQSLREEEGLNFNVVQALKEEARRRRKEETDHLKTQVDAIENLARPFLNPEPEAEAGGSFTESIYWGAHPDAVSAVEANGDRRGSLSATHTSDWFGEDLIRREAFSQYEIICYRNLYGVRAENLRKFSAEDDFRPSGTYYQAYRERVRRLTGESDEPAVTPHLDRRWHLPVYLADTLNPQDTKQASRRVDRAFVRGLAHGLFQEAVIDQESTWRFEDERGPSVIRVYGDVCSPGAHSLHEALQYNPVITDRVMERTDEVWEVDKDNYPINRQTDIANHRFHEGCHDIPGVSGDRNLLDVILGFAEEAPGKSEVLETGERVLRHALEEIDAYYTSVYGEHQTNKASNRAANLIERLRDDSEIFQETDNKQLRQKWESVIDITTSELRS